MSGCSQEAELINSPDPDKLAVRGHHDVYWISSVLGLGGIEYARLHQDRLTCTVSYKQAQGWAAIVRLTRLLRQTPANRALAEYRRSST
jgi:hypothetical protein